jgi:hypothetical protein
MPTVYVRWVSLRDALSDAEVAAYWRFTLKEVIPALLKVPGIRSVKLYSGAGGCVRTYAMHSRWRTRAPTSACWPIRSSTPSSPKPMWPGI